MSDIKETATQKITMTITGPGTPYTQVFSENCFGEKHVTLEYEIIDFEWSKDENGKKIKTIKKANLLYAYVYNNED